MLCFRDRIYCHSPNCTNKCGRQLTQEVIDSAEKGGCLIASGYFCGKPEEFIDKGNDG